MVATPIGNLEDVTLRAIRVLREVDAVAAEDTRRARVLLAHLGIEKRVVAYYDAVESARAPELVRRALAGESIALISDAGTPLVADPGYRLVLAATEAGVPVIPVPGPSAPLALLSCAGLPPGRFTFVGFLPSRSSARRRALAELADREETLLILETARRLPAALADIAAVFGERRAVIGRELTKRFEEVLRGGLDELGRAVRMREEAGTLKGEIVIAVEGRASGGSGATEERAGLPGSGLDEVLLRRLEAGESVASAARASASELHLPRRIVYRRALDLHAERKRPR